MKSSALAELNFRKLFHYDHEPKERGRYSAPMPCTGFCVSCEKQGLLDRGDCRLDQMSHGADTEDFERAICTLPTGGPSLSVVFLLESPGGYYGNGCPIIHEGVTKQPPVHHYYWTPSQLTEWPTDSNKVVPKSYGPYFAYIIATHRLHNAYFTNIIKCALATNNENKFKSYYVVANSSNRDSKILTNCFSLFLSEEMMIAKPRIVFFFGRKAARMGNYAGLRSILPAAQFVVLYHPAARYIGQSRIIHQNDERIRDALRDQTDD
jgi:hypothetical protein